MEAWIGEREEDEILTLLMTNGAVAGPVYDMPRIFQDPHYAARDDLITVPDSDAGNIRMAGVVPKFSVTPGHVRTAGPHLGQHNHEVYRGLGVSEDELERLRDEEII